MTEINSNRNYSVEDFDQRAAVELAAMHLSIRAAGGGRRGEQEGTYAKVVFDRQIVAIAKVNNVTALYSDDDGLGKFAERSGIKVVRSWELPMEKHPLFRDTLDDAPVGLLEGQIANSDKPENNDDTKYQRRTRKIVFSDEEI